MADSKSSFVTSIEGLASLYAPPAERIVKATLDHVNSVGRAFINASPFLVMATGNQNGFDCSPKGDQPGFVQVSEDGRTLLIPDRRGNNKIDGLKNLAENSQIGLIFFVPGAAPAFTDLIPGGPAALAAKSATTTIPIIFSSRAERPQPRRCRPRT